MDMNSDEINTGGSAFWILMTLISLVSLLLIMIWSFQNNSARGAILALIFFAMIITSAFLSRMKIFDWASWGDNTLSFVIGFIIWTIISRVSTLSVLAIEQNQYFATISSELPVILGFSTSVILIPIAEEMFWMIGLPFALISIMNIIGRRWSVWQSAFLQIPVIILIGASSFAYFHVGKTFIGFIIFAIVFRSIMLGLVYSEHYFNILEKVNLVAAFGLGAHIANNLGAFGYATAWLTITSNFWPLGFAVIMFMLLMVVSAIDKIVDIFQGNSDKDKLGALSK